MWRRLSLVIVMALAGLGPLAGAQAAPREVQAPSAPTGGTVGGACTEAELDAALAGGGTVTFACGGPKTILILSQKTISQSTTIDGGGIITITGGLATRLFFVNGGGSLSLRDIVLDSGYSPGANGGAIVNEGTLNLERTTIQYSQTNAGSSGGAIYTTGPTTIHDSQFLHNTAGSAGALHADGAARVVIDTSHFQFNHAVDTTGQGGAVWVGLGADATIRQSTLSHNDTEGSGGAVYNQGRLTSDGNVYLGNKTTEEIGASFRGFVGAIASFGPISIANDILHANYSRFGGGLFVGEAGSSTHARVSSTRFTRNEVVYSGGGLYTSADTTVLTVSDSLFGGYEAASGGGLSRNNTILSVYRSTFGLNQAGSGGGLVSSAGPGLGVEVKVHDSTFYSNVVTNLGGGGVIHNQGLMELRNLTLEGNSHGVFNNGSGEVMEMANTVLHNVGLNCDGDGTKPQSQGGNFSTDNSCSLSMGGDVQGAGLDPLLAPLIELMQPVAHFFIPLPGSPLINTAAAACSPQDQRRAYRPDACDKGAIEFGGLLLSVFLPLLLRFP